MKTAEQIRDRIQHYEKLAAEIQHRIASMPPSLERVKLREQAEKWEEKANTLQWVLE
jgi:hypothetical protein